MLSIIEKRKQEGGRQKGRPGGRPYGPENKNDQRRFEFSLYLHAVPCYGHLNSAI
jgi:hypothetical protein